MKLATMRTQSGRTRAVRVDEDRLVDLGVEDVGVLLREQDWRERAAAATGPVDELRGAAYAPLVPTPGKIVCVGLNYRNHILEMGRELPEFPTLFTKYAEALVGANDDIVKPPETDQFDWECELAVVIGSTVRRARGPEAERAIAGFSVLNDVTCRDWQYRTQEWLQGKSWEATTPLGPYLVTPDDLPGGVRPELAITTEVDGETVQKNNTADLLFDPVALVEYISTMVTLRPGDVIATGTPGGVGHARKPARYLEVGQRLVTEVENLGRCDNTVVADPGSVIAVRSLADSRRWMDEGTTLFRAGLARLDDADLDALCDLPDWTGRHLVAHVAANADALLNLVRWAATGDETPMYSSPKQRAADIEAGAKRDAGELRRWVDTSSDRLADGLSGLSDDQWACEVRTAQGRQLPATEIPWLRAREVLIHAVDLGCGLGFSDLPEDFEVALIADVVAKRSAGEDHPALVLRADGHQPWAVTGAGAPTEVHGTVAGLAAYLTGRAGSDLPPGAPELPAWL